ncbi:hypothetical protein BO71DRAFT_1288 [Aspergillus ellipticus CBS 707.79]|uniref:Uncharacterized protein n=1 Tax=Aspergillus ellipticus CBS 707.79 TaxID=1448320 RepID=A0A319E101_9EURO|nr:hypothetical protein BO71DRAFT_1288 [Aspergillus ellipticus CBS 707.79]
MRAAIAACVAGAKRRGISHSRPPGRPVRWELGESERGPGGADLAWLGGWPWLFEVEMTMDGRMLAFGGRRRGGSRHDPNEPQRPPLQNLIWPGIGSASIPESQLEGFNPFRRRRKGPRLKTDSRSTDIVSDVDREIKRLQDALDVGDHDLRAGLGCIISCIII